MSDKILNLIESKIDTLIHHNKALESECERMRIEIHSFQSKKDEWDQERAQLIEKNVFARKRVEAMITHLKSLETQA